LPQETNKRKGAIYDRFASRYDCAIAPLERRLLSRLRARTLRHLPANSTLLEIGAGTGLNFPHYPQGAHGAASELSCEMLKLAAGRERPQHLSLVQCNAERLPFSDDAFDAAFATLVFCSVPSPQAAFSEIRRVVKPGGTVALLEHVRPSNLLGPVFDLLSLATVPLFEDHFNRRTAREAALSGLSVASIESHAAGILQVIVCRV
jgi:ubiquinone/menaquinone biosynthesis C-methylase UbiE